MKKIHFPILLLLVPFLYFCKPQQKSKLAEEADSLILLTLEMQQRISSPEIHRLSEFQEEVIRDLGILNDPITHGTDPAHEEEQPSGLLGQYSTLNYSLGQCMRACSYYHEEAFLLENTIEEIKELAELKGADHTQLRELLMAEWTIYFDLFFRIDSSLENITHHAKTFYSLKPGIDSLLTQAESPPIK